MRVAALYDIHGNLPALEEVLDDVQKAGVDRIVIGGDVLPGPLDVETLSFLENLDLPMDSIRGNGESAILACCAGDSLDALPEAARDAIRRAAERLTQPQIARLAGWPATAPVEVPPLGTVLFCHATPRSDTEIFTVETPEARLRPVFEPAGVPVVVCGHTHMQFDRMVGSTRVVNAGSVGMPFGSSAAEWLLLGPTVELRRTPYDRARAADRIRSLGDPRADDFVANFILQTPGAKEMLERFRKAELPE